MKTLKLKNYHLVESPKGAPRVFSIVSWLDTQMLHGKKVRSKARFEKIIEDRYKEVNKERFNLLEKYSNKNEKGKVLFKDKDGKQTTDPALGKRYDISDENYEKVEKEFSDYLLEDYVIDVTPANKETLSDIKEILLETVSTFSGDNGRLYAEWCDAFEKI